MKTRKPLQAKTDLRTATADKMRAAGLFPNSLNKVSPNRGKGPKPTLSTAAVPSPEATEGRGSIAARMAYLNGSTIPQAGASKSSKLEREADRLFSRRIRERDGWTCQFCGCGGEWRKGFMHCAHVVRRGYHATRWDDGNAICLCKDHHQHFQNRLPEWKAFLLTTGIDYDEVLVVARHGSIPHVEDVIALLKSGQGYRAVGL